ncbi:MAG: hypothetical protein QMD78_03325 [Methanocellales archaeon]|nr:hypothetical protein [Methanocellales archaeon]
MEIHHGNDSDMLWIALLTGLLSFMVKERVKQMKVEKEAHRLREVFSCEECGDVFKGRLKFSFRYGFIDMVEDIGLYVILGLIIAGIIAALAPGVG